MACTARSTSTPPSATTVTTSTRRRGDRHHARRLSKANFDETVEAVIRLGVDPRKADQMVRGTVALPSGSGKDVRVAVFAQGEAAREAEAAGAEFVGAEDLAAQIEGGFLDFDVTIATPDLMPLLGKLGRVLGPRGLMPNPKTGTVTNEVGKAVERVQGRQGRVPHRSQRQRARARSARPASTGTPPGQPHRRDRRAAPGQAVVGQGSLLPQGHAVLDDGSRRAARPASLDVY